MSNVKPFYSREEIAVKGTLELIEELRDMVTTDDCTVVVVATNKKGHEFIFSNKPINAETVYQLAGHLELAKLRVFRAVDKLGALDMS